MMAGVSRLVFVVVAAGLMASTSARAGDCGAQKGKTIFEDSFKDKNGGFEDSDLAKYGATGLQLTLPKGDQDVVFINSKGTATTADSCAVAIMPQPVGEGNLASVGITLLYKDDQNMVALQVFSDNTVQIERWSGGDSGFLLEEQLPEIKATPGSEVSIRAVVQNGAITPYVNGIALKTTPVPPTEGADKFGLYLGIDKPADKELMFNFKSLKITAVDAGK